MKKICLLITFSLTLLSCQNKSGMDVTFRHVDFSNIHVNDAFFSPCLEKVATITIPVCVDQTEVQTGRIRNFENVASGTGGHSGIFFDDSDVYKALEAIAYSLINHPDSALEAKADKWTDKIAAAQLEDGYINTFFTLTGIENRWTDMDKHEMYCAGHLIEAGIAYQQATGKTKLLEVGKRMADHFMARFNPEGQHWVPGHEEIELALVKLSEATGEKKYFDEACWLLSQRGHDYAQGNGMKDASGSWNKAYYQDIVPAEDLRSISGHAVRAMYLFCGMCDVAARGGMTDYQTALDSVWEDVTKRNMYVTGGIGVAYCTEGFAGDYELPNKEAYCESCASVGMALWNMRMAEWKGDSRYVDIMERTIYNALLAGISLKGDRFFYVNPLASDGNHHRQAWFGCACCPSNLCRFLASIGNYIYATADKDLYVNLYIGNEAQIPFGKGNLAVSLTTAYPWKGNSSIRFDGMEGNKKFALHLRIPDWCKSYQISMNGEQVEYNMENGYATIRRQWKADDQVDISLDMPVEIVKADPRVKADEGRCAIQRGPVVYCAEQADNALDIDEIAVKDGTEFNVHFDADMLGGVSVIDMNTPKQTEVRLIPYHAWDNRTPGKMAVWILDER